jgi:hypothetical protein
MAAASRLRAARVLANPNVIIVRPLSLWTGPAGDFERDLRCNFATILKDWLSSRIVGVKKYASSAADLETCDELHRRGDEAPSYGMDAC